MATGEETTEQKPLMTIEEIVANQSILNSFGAMLLLAPTDTDPQQSNVQGPEKPNDGEKETPS